MQTVVSRLATRRRENKLNDCGIGNAPRMLIEERRQVACGVAHNIVIRRPKTIALELIARERCPEENNSLSPSWTSSLSLFTFKGIKLAWQKLRCCGHLPPPCYTLKLLHLSHSETHVFLCVYFRCAHFTYAHRTVIYIPY